MNNILWVTSFDKTYFHYVFKKVYPTWQLLPGDHVFYVDDTINELDLDSRVIASVIDRGRCPEYIAGKEVKFWLKSRSTVQALRESIGKYDYMIWLDADVRVLQSPDQADILPGEDDLFSVNEKTVINPPSHEAKLLNPTLIDLGIDTGFLAWNLRHPQILDLIELYDRFWDTTTMAQMIRKYDTYALKHIVIENQYQYRNLWNGKYSAGKRYCGFEDSALDQYFYHYWGNKNKDNIDDMVTRQI